MPNVSQRTSMGNRGGLRSRMGGVRTLVEGTTIAHASAGYFSMNVRVGHSVQPSANDSDQVLTASPWATWMMGDLNRVLSNQPTVYWINQSFVSFAGRGLLVITLKYIYNILS